MAKKKVKAAPKKASTAKSTSKNFKLKVDKVKLVEYAKSAGKVLALLVILLLVDLFVQYLNNDYSVAIVNGQRIPRREYVQTLEKMYGTQIVDSLVEEELVKQIGQEKGVEVDAKEIDEAYEEIELQFGSKEALDAALVENDMTEEDLREQLKNELTLKKIIEPRLEYTDEDLAEFFEEYKDFIYEDTSNITFEDEKDDVELIYKDQKIFEERGTLLEEFRQESTIQVNVAGTGQDTGYGFFKATINLIRNFTEEQNKN